MVTEHLFVSYPDLSEGQLAKLRAAVVNSRALADIARDLDLGAVIHLGRGEESTGGRDKSSILADTMEAVIGAVFLQHGVEAARDFVHHLFDGLMADVATRGAGLDWKTSLQEIASVAGLLLDVGREAEVRHEHARLAGDVGAEVPRVARGIEREVGDLVHVRDPGVLGRRASPRCARRPCSRR